MKFKSQKKTKTKAVQKKITSGSWHMYGSRLDRLYFMFCFFAQLWRSVYAWYR